LATFEETLELVRAELAQRREEGCDVTGLEDRLANARDGSDADDILRALEALEPAGSFPYREPSTLEEIRALRPDGPRRMEMPLDDSDLLDRILGGWLGRAAGCSLGKPVEGWTKARIDSYLEHAGALPLDDYMPLVEDHPDGLVPRFPESTRGQISYMARDDDMDYPVLGLHILEQQGPDYAPLNVARTWLSRLPYYVTYTAERAAYGNMVNGIWPPESASHRNPYREWIGAQIRADVFGYVCPGLPERGADLAFRDASISHVKNGIYGEMFVAAMLAASFVQDDASAVIEAGLSEIPRDCRLAEAIHDTMAWCRTAAGWEQVWDRINEKYGHYHPVHTINNAALVVMALLKGERDFQKSIVVAVRGGWDTDCNGATAGSILGVMLGARALPEKWVGVLNDRLISAVRGYEDNRISDLARRTRNIARKVTAGA
jgi:ADP-ribosylglycohydrolase